MNLCPHCRHSTISGRSKWASSTTSPAVCSNCKGLSFVPTVTSSGILAAGAVLLTLTLFATIATHSSIVAASGILGSIVFYVGRWRTASLAATSARYVASAQKVGWFMASIAFLAALLR